MDFDDLRFKHVGLSNDGAVIFCELDNGSTYALPLCSLETAEDWDPRATPKHIRIIHHGYAAMIEFNTKVKIDFPVDFVLHICEPAYTWYKSKAKAKTAIGARIRQIRELRGLTLEELAARCKIAKPNLSRLENDKLTPQFATIKIVARALGIHPALLTAKQALTVTIHVFVLWKQNLLWRKTDDEPPVYVPAIDLVKAFLAEWPEHKYARQELLQYANPGGGSLNGYPVNAERWLGVHPAVAAR